MNFQGKTIVVTGGASGLGEAVVRRICSSGGKVVIADLSKEKGDALAAALGSQVAFARTDVTDETSARAAVELAVSRFGGLDGLVNCAGIGVAEKLLDKEGVPQKLESFGKVISVNLVGTFNMIRLAAAAMVRTPAPEGVERGVIVNTASVAAFDGQVGQVAYSASKGGIVAMTLPLARELARHGIRVMTIAPGIFETPMMAGLPEKAKISLGQQVPFPPRLGKPEEFAALVAQAFENPMLNGEVIRLDGALRMAAR